MFKFAYPYLLFLLLTVPLVGAFYLMARYARRRNLKRFGKPEILQPLMPEVSKYKPQIKIALQLLALAAIIIAICRPWGAMRGRTENREGIEIAIAMDVSNSMLASVSSDDGGVSRLRTAKMVLEKLLNKLDNDRVGLVVYAGGAYTLLPVTSDYISAKMFLNSINTDIVPVQGTAIADAIHQSMNLFSSKKGVGKAIILITDAEDLEGDALEAVKEAAKSGVTVNVIGVGSEQGARIPVAGGYFMDDEGNVVNTKLNEALATQMAEAGKGIYVNASDSDAIPELMKQLGGIKKTAWSANVYAVHDELFPLFVWIALLLLVVDLFMLERKIGWLSKITFFKKEVDK